MHIKEYARKYDRDESTNFAAACYDGNTVEDLTAIAITVKNGADIDDVADGSDIAGWNLVGPAEWYDAIMAALEERTAELL